MESKTSPALGLLGVINIDLSGLAASTIAVHVLNTAETGPVLQVSHAAIVWSTNYTISFKFFTFLYHIIGLTAMMYDDVCWLPRRPYDNSMFSVAPCCLAMHRCRFLWCHFHNVVSLLLVANGVEATTNGRRSRSTTQSRWGTSSASCRK